MRESRSPISSRRKKLSADPAWQIARAAAADAAALSLVAGASFLETFAGVLPGEDIVAHCTAKSSLEAFAEWIADPASVVALAREPLGAPVGYTVLTSADLPIETGPDDIELKRIYMLARMQGSGLGGTLMDRAIADARALGRTRMLLGVYGGNARAQAFYEKHGFAVVGTRRFLVGQTEHDDLLYGRTL